MTPTTTLTPAQYAWLFLSSNPKVRPAQWLEALAHYGVSAEELVDMAGTTSASSLLNMPLVEALNQCDDTIIKRTETWLGQPGRHHVISLDSGEYPSQFTSLTHPPLVLFVNGEPTQLLKHQLAMVGSRRATHAGKDTAHSLARGVSECGISIVSGLAQGIDAAAHRGALQGGGGTVAFVGTGPDTIYPASNQRLHDDIIRNNGCVVSEYPPGTPARRYHFPRRNRLIAAISLGTLVVEAKIKSGTLITANLAADMGKDVFAVPGNITNPLSEGCHWLIQQGAKLVTCANDMLEEFPALVDASAMSGQNDNQKSEANSLATDKLLDSVDLDVTPVDVIAERSTLPVSAVMAALLEYELRGLVAAVPGGYVKLRGK